MAVAVSGFQYVEPTVRSYNPEPGLIDQSLQANGGTSSSFGVRLLGNWTLNSWIQVQSDNPLLVVEQEYVLPDRNAVLAYLITRQELLPYLADIVNVSQLIYGDDTTVSLRRDWDPDTDLEYLIAGIRTALSPEDAYQHLFRLREDWWFGVPEDVENQILIVNEFE